MLWVTVSKLTTVAQFDYNSSPFSVFKVLEKNFEKASKHNVKTLKKSRRLNLDFK